MAKWFVQAREIERLRRENERLLKLLAELRTRLGEDADNLDIYGVSAEEKKLVEQGRSIEAIKAYRVRTGADLLTAKNAIDSVS
ncbi:50S ribosomal protein L7/L12 [Actinomyces sp. B33]|nr:50S ribosomal protein L7/L12 [Actinomyces sp. B33]MDC4233820.1 50S ribosomal protein L7/L12 [Actinomyces sp. B33]